MKSSVLYGLVGFGLASAISGIFYYLKEQKNKEKKANGKPKENK